MSFTLEVQGLEAFRKYVAELPSKVLKKGEEAAAILALRVAEEARIRAPVRTGFLRSRVVARGSLVESEAPYSLFVEYGTRFMRPRPFLRPAVEAVRPMIVAVVKERVEEALRGA